MKVIPTPFLKAFLFIASLILLIIIGSSSTSLQALEILNLDSSSDPLVHDEAFIQLINKYAKTWQAGKSKFFEGKRLSHARRLIGLGLPTPEQRASYPKKNSLMMGEEANSLEKYLVKMDALPDSYNAANDSNYYMCQQLHRIRNQEQCGSCWAFSISEMVADRFCIGTRGKINTIMSPQWMVSCDTADNGCNGGEFPTAFQFVETTGLVSDGCVPYQSGNGFVPPCPNSCTNGEDINVRYRTKNSRNFDVNDMKSVQASILANGPVISGFKVYRDFYNYRSGVYKHVAGGLVGGHAIKVVGWGVTQSNVPYWIVANSWSDEWGMNGYFWILRGTNECSIEENMWETIPAL
uniref:Fowlerpain-3 n=1 Tax=Naegleria fowleri TaxID=5763 RepID=A0A1L1XWG8_NAEFO|nr:Fowlerpain-3 [Naegleria fowleri]